MEKHFLSAGYEHHLPPITTAHVDQRPQIVPEVEMSIGCLSRWEDRQQSIKPHFRQGFCHVSNCLTKEVLDEVCNPTGHKAPMEKTGVVVLPNLPSAEVGPGELV